MKMQKFALFLNKSLKINVSVIKSIVKLEIIVIIQMNTEVMSIIYVI